jgi:hypothetical protein
MLETHETIEGATEPRRPASPAELRRAELRLAHAGQWVAWTPDDSDIAAVAETREAIQEMVRSLGIEGLTLELVPPANFR